VGLVSDDLRTFRRAPADATVVDAVAGGVMGFRRADAAARGLLDEHFVAPDHLDTWWSFLLRDPADDADADPDAEADDAPARSAVQLHVDAPPAQPAPGDPPPDGADRTRGAKRNFYRFLKRFATRRDLLTGSADPDR
jgi:hypothetical protein